LTTLWILSVASIVAMAAALSGRDAVVAGSSRVELERARWLALGCERRAVAAIDAVLRDAPSDADATLAWRTLAAQIAASRLLEGCDVRAEAAGTKLDVNAASDDMIEALLRATDASLDVASMIDALDDWRDSDDVVRPAGAERAWYESEGRPAPRNGPLADVRELARVRGFETMTALDTLVTTEPGRISLATAPAGVLMAVPGVTRETADAIVSRQLAGLPLENLLDIVGSISDASAETLATRFSDAARATTPDPDAWLLTVRLTRGSPVVTASLTWRVIRIGRRCAVARTRSDT
ncbi:MAG: general secretion pathway protein GspK, partial [Gemmatimonadaceae bacterium]